VYEPYRKEHRDLNTDVVICGAGISGIATAYYLTEQGVTDILLVDKIGPMMLTSDKSVEAYRNWWSTDIMARFMNRSIDLMEELAQVSDNVFNLNRRGYLYVTTQADQVAAFEQTAREFDSRGLGPVRMHSAPGSGYTPAKAEGYTGEPVGADLLLDPKLISQQYDYLTEDAQAVLHARRAGWLSAQQLGMSLLGEVKRRGVKELRGEVTAVQTDSDGVCAVEVHTADGPVTVSTRHFVDAAGPFVGHVAALLDVDLPVHNVLHEKIVFQDLERIVPRDAPMIILNDPVHLYWTDEERAFWEEEPEYRWLLDVFPPGCHLRPEGTSESPWLLIAWGFHDEATPATWKEPAYSEEFPEIALRGAVHLVPELKRYIGRVPTPLMHDGGFYTKTPENLPLIGALPVKGAFVAGALAGYGVMAAPAAGELAAAWITEGSERPDYAEALAPDRYDDPDYMASLDEGALGGEL
jgi:glycine/D-amino acid oxidase-like deaminating enzyme